MQTKTLNHEKGSFYEKKALQYLQQNGLQLIETNFRTKLGEIDLIMKDREYLVFIEVKYRKSGQFGNSLEAVSLQKQKTICRVSDTYRIKEQISEFTPIRYDVIAVDGNQIQWIRNAFMYHPMRR